MLEIVEKKIEKILTVKVVAVGNTGISVINRLAVNDINGVELIGVDTNFDDLRVYQGINIEIADEFLNNTDIGVNSDIVICLKGADVVIITCELGGGVGSVLAPAIAALSREMGILTLGVITTPFEFEGKTKIKNAAACLEKMKKEADAVFVVSNDKLFDTLDKNLALSNMFKEEDEALQQIIMALINVIKNTSDIKIDFDDIKTILTNKGNSYIGIGKGKAIDAVKQAINNPLLDAKIECASDIIIRFSGDFKMDDVSKAVSCLLERTGKDVNIIMGAQFGDDIADECTVTVMAMGDNC